MMRGSDIQKHWYHGRFGGYNWRHGMQLSSQAPGGFSARERAMLRGLKAIREPAMRTARMAELLRGDPAPTATFLHNLIVQSGSGLPGVDQALDAVAVSIGSHRIEYEQRRKLYAAASDLGAPCVARLFVDIDRIADEVAALEASLDGSRPLAPNSRPMTLGERKSLARGRRSETLLQLLADPHPQVVEILLGNPHLIEADVLTIASRRPALPDNQRLIFRSDRWRPRHRVRRALVLNPYSPAALGLLLLPTLRGADLTDIAADSKLPLLLRQQAVAVSELRARAGAHG
jgi:hypothetical protein